MLSLFACFSLFDVCCFCGVCVFSSYECLLFVVACCLCCLLICVLILLSMCCLCLGFGRFVVVLFLRVLFCACLFCFALYVCWCLCLLRAPLQ